MEKDVSSFYKITCSDNIMRYYPNIPLIRTTEMCPCSTRGYCYSHGGGNVACCKLSSYKVQQVHLAYWIDPEHLTTMAYEGVTYARVCPSCGDFVIIEHKDKLQGTLSCISRPLCQTCDLYDWKFGKHSCFDDDYGLMGPHYEVHRAYIYNEFSYLLDHVGRVGDKPWR